MQQKSSKDYVSEKKNVLFLAVMEDTHYMYVYTGHLTFRPLFMIGHGQE